MIDYIFYFTISLIIYFLLRRLFLEHIYIDRGGKYVVITGCDSGFGRKLAIQLIEQGVNVFAACYTQKGIASISQTVLDIKQSGIGKIYPFQLDVTSDESVMEAKKHVTSILDEKNAQLWGLVNNAGIFTTYGPDDWCTTNEYKLSLNVNTLGAIRMCHAFVPLLKRSNGRVVTMGSTAGRLHGLYVAPYVTAKFAVEAYMDCLRLEMRKFNVSVHIIEPGAFKTELLDSKAQHTRIDKIWSTLPVETKIEYGDEYKSTFVTSWDAGVNIVANKNIQWVVDCYSHALFSWWPRLRYAPGWDAIFLFVPISVLPTSWQDNILSLFYYMGPGPSMPAALIKRYQKTRDSLHVKYWISFAVQLVMIPFAYGIFFTKPANKNTIVQTGNHTVNAK